MQIDKFIAYQIETQFPALYKESGPEMIALVKSYYEFLETASNQATYNSRRLFEYRDIDYTINDLLIFFKNKFLKDLPLNEDTLRLTLKRVLNLYRRKGTQEGIELFFQMFFDEKIKIYYPSSDILKPSDSNWSTEKYIQLYPTNPFSLKTLFNKEIFGSGSNATAIVENTFFIIVGGTIIPVIYVSNVLGSFVANENIMLFEGNEKTVIGRVFGSMASIAIENDATFLKTNGHFLGEAITIQNSYGTGGKLIVDGISKFTSGEIQYTLVDGGWGYSKENTHLLVSNQIIFLPENNIVELEPLEVLTDQFGNTGTVIGQRSYVVGVRMDSGDEFIADSIISDSNSTVITYDFLSDKNDSTPGPLLPESPLEDFPVQVEELSNVQTIFTIPDVIEGYLGVSLDAVNFNAAPATQPMSGTADPVTLATQLDSAFELESLEIGTIESFLYIKPGENVENDVFAIVYDPVVAGLSKHDQILTITPSSTVPTALFFNVGSIVQQGPILGKILSVSEFSITVRVYNASGFDALYPITYNGLNYNISSAFRDYSSKVSGYNAIMEPILNFAAGQITSVKVTNSGYGYANNSVITLLDSNGIPAAKGRISTSGVGETEGKWTTKTSHIGVEYNKRIQDSFYYQAYSYEIKSKLDINNYEKVYKDIMHTAGTKLFGVFEYEDLIDPNTAINIVIEE